MVSYTGSAAVVIQQQEYTATLMLSEEAKKITDLSLTITPAPPDMWEWTGAIKKSVQGKRIEELCRYTASLLIKLLHLTAANYQFASLIADAIMATHADFAEKTSRTKLKETIKILDSYEEGLPARTVEDIALEYGDCGCNKEEHSH